MTALDLENTVRALGCLTFDLEEEFNYLSNTALQRVYNDLRIIKRGSFYASGILPSMERYDIHHFAGKDVSYPLVGKAFSIKVCGGAPKITICTGSSNTSYFFEDGVTILKGFLQNNMGIADFSGDFDYDVLSICCYDKIVSDDRDQIPDGSDFHVYKANKLLPDFLSFASAPVDAEGNLIESAVVTGASVKLPSDYKGEIFFNYVKGPKRMIYFADDTEIDIAPEHEGLLVLMYITLHYLDVDGQKSRLFLDNYKDLLATLPSQQNYSYVSEPVDGPRVAEYKILDGWV